MTRTLKIESLTATHRTEEFRCNEPQLDGYLHRHALRHTKEGWGRTFVLVDEDRLVGYYTSCASSIDRSSIPRSTPTFPTSAILLAKLAVDANFQRQGFAGELLMHSLDQTYQISKRTGVHAIHVDALNEGARNLYVKLGFQELLDDPMHLFMYVRDVAKLF